MVGAYTTFLMQECFKAYVPAEWFDHYFLAAMPAAFLVAALVGLILEATIIRFLYGRPPASSEALPMFPKAARSFLISPCVKISYWDIGPGRLRGTAASPKKAAFDEVYTLFPKLTQIREHAGGVLSGGEQQQLAIGRALLSNPKVLLLDEPTEGIQPSIVDQIEDVIIGFKVSRRFAILLVEQGVALRCATGRFLRRDDQRNGGGGGEDERVECGRRKTAFGGVGLGELHILMLADRAHSEGARSMARSKGYAAHLTSA